MQPCIISYNNEEPIMFTQIKNPDEEEVTNTRKYIQIIWVSFIIFLSVCVITAFTVNALRFDSK